MKTPHKPHNFCYEIVDLDWLGGIKFVKNTFIGRINRSVTKHLSTHGKLDPRGGLYWCPNKTWTSSISAFGTLKIIEELKKLFERVNNSKKKNKPPNVIKANSQTAKNNFVYCSIVIRVQRRFVKLQVALL